MNPDYSIIIPLKDEQENIALLLQEIDAVMQSLELRSEVICIDDGSSDDTLSVLEKEKKRRPYLRVLSFDKNYGQSAAFAAGFAAALAPFIITLDGDGQNDPKDIEKLIKEGANFDLVCGWLKERKDKAQKRWISKLANKVRSCLCEDGVHDTGCSLKLYRKEALQRIKMFKGMHRFLPALFKIEGLSVKEVVVHHRERVHGKTKYHFFNRLIGPIIDMLAVRWMAKRHIQYKIKGPHD